MTTIPLRACARCGLPTPAAPVAIVLHGEVGAPFVACLLCRDVMAVQLPREGMRLVRPDGSPLSTPRGALVKDDTERPAGGRAIPVLGPPPGLTRG